MAEWRRFWRSFRGGEPPSETRNRRAAVPRQVLIGARSEEQFSTIEVFVYEEPVDNLYAHHDIPLPIFPLCLAWMDFRPTPSLAGAEVSAPRSNMLAVGTCAPRGRSNAKAMANATLSNTRRRLLAVGARAPGSAAAPEAKLKHTPQRAQVRALRQSISQQTIRQTTRPTCAVSRHSSRCGTST